MKRPCQVPVRYLTDDDRHTPVQAPSLEVGETVLLFLTQDDSSFDLKGNNFVIAGGGEAWGKLFVRDGRVTTLDPAVESKPLDEVTEWIDAARFSLAKPGLLAGEMSGLNGGDRATIRLLYLGSGLREEDGVPVDEWTSGRWETDHGSDAVCNFRKGPTTSSPKPRATFLFIVPVV